MLPWKRIVLVSSILLLDIGAFLLLAILSISYGDVTELLEDKSYQRLERSVTVGWWLWWGINAGYLECCGIGYSSGTQGSASNCLEVD